MLNAWLQKLEWLIDRFCTVLLASMVIVCFMQVVNRYVIGKAYFWAEEFTLFALIWICFIGAALAVRQKAHTRIDFFVNLLPGKGTKAVQIFANVLCLCYILAISYYSLAVVRHGMKTLALGLKIAKGWAYIALPLSGLLMAMYLSLQIVQGIRDFNLEDRPEGKA